VNDLAQDRIKKPKSDDMSMDEILASIRKIISSSDDAGRLHKTADELSTQYAQRNDLNNMRKTNSQPAPTLSAREQLLSLTKPDLYDTDFASEIYQKTTGFNKASDYNDNAHYNASQDDIKQKPLYQKLNNQPDVPQGIANDKADQDEEILRALNEIRETLSASTQSAIHHSLEKDIFSKQNSYKPVNPNNVNPNNVNPNDVNPNNVNPNDINPDTHLNDLPKHTAGKVIDSKTPKSKDTFDDIDLKPAQFTGDAVPEFLKKFKKQQETDREKIQNSANNIQYNFSKLSSFDEPLDEVVTLTDKVMPMTKDSLKHQQEKQHQEKTAKTSFSKLRQGTEEIMRRATERAEHNVTDDADDDLSSDDSPMADLIMRTLKPMLQEWIDENLHFIAEQVLRHEFRRGLK
jgi:cell pole-organizing protein PopZ